MCQAFWGQFFIIAGVGNNKSAICLVIIIMGRRKIPVFAKKTPIIIYSGIGRYAEYPAKHESERM